MIQQTLVLVKPDGVQRGLMSEMLVDIRISEHPENQTNHTL